MREQLVEGSKEERANLQGEDRPQPLLARPCAMFLSVIYVRAGIFRAPRGDASRTRSAGRVELKT